MAGRRAALLVLLSLAACEKLVADSGPRPQAVSPAGAYQGQQVRVRVSGTGFDVRGVQRLGGGGEISAQFEIRIGGVTLTDVRYLGDAGGTEVVDGLVPADLPVGVHDVELRDPYGRIGVLRGAFTESDHAPPSLSAAIDVPPRVEVGVLFATSVHIANAGATDARISTLEVSGVGAGAGTVVPAGGSVDLQALTYVPVAGSANVQLHATALDAVTGLPLAPLDASAPLTALSPPLLVASVGATPADVDVGQSFTVTVTVANQGEVDALSVMPELLPSPVFTAGSGTAQDVPAGTSRAFATNLRATVQAVDSFEIVASGTDQLSGATTTSLPARSPAISVVKAAALSAGTPSIPAALSRGQTFTVSAIVANSGQADALGVRPSLSVARTGGADLTVVAAPAPHDISAGASETFVWSCAESGTAAGTLALTAVASGSDANSGAAVSASSQAATATVQEPAVLSVSVEAPSAVSRGQAFEVSAVVTNTGGTIARAVQVTAQTASTGGAAASTASAPAAVDIGRGASATFTFEYVENGGAPGTLTFQLSATGTDAISGVAESATGSSGAMPVLTPASLSISSFVLKPTSIQRGQTFTAKVTVTNTGQAGAASVTASLAQAVSGGAHASTSSTPGWVGLAGGGSATFTWTFAEDGVSPGSIAFSATASGIDADSNAPLTTPASSATILVQPPESTQVAGDPFAGDGTTFAYLFSYQGMVYAGPNQTGSGAVRMAPDGSGAASVSWQLEVNTNASNPARNTAYQPPYAPICHTIGTPGCLSNTTACGPDNEAGRAMFASGTSRGTEWYLVSGASTSGGSRYAYMTNAGFPLASGGYDDLAFVQVQAGQSGSARMMTAAHFFQDQLFIGFLDNSGTVSTSQQNAPVLNALTTMPALPGSIAALGTDLVDLQAVRLPALGTKGSPANNGHSWLMIDSMTDLNGSLYVANNGGIARSVGAPAPCSSTGCANWANATPSASAWSGKTSVTVDSTVLGSLQPSQRAVPGMVAFGAYLFAARNTTSGPQLWSCDPSKGSDPQQCEPGDWSLVAPNSFALDPQLTQFNSPLNSALTLLVATPDHLYVGFDASGGVQIFRTALPGASARSDFTGQAGCDASQSTCAGIGGAGLAASLTHIFDAHSFSYSGVDWVYLTAGTGYFGPKVYRFPP